MKTIWRLCIGLVLPAFVISCFNPPEYPVVPEIEFNSIQFVDTPDPAGQLIADTLVLKVDFTDGDGDIGLSDADDILSAATAQYAERFYFDNKGIAYAVQDPSQLDNTFLRYSSRKASPFDTLPPFTKPYDCINWKILYNTTGTTSVPTDTLYFQLNPDHYNIFVDFLISDGASYQEYDFRKEYCTTYDGRLPILSKDVSQENPLEGTIRYAMTGTGFKLIFGNKTIKLRIQIQDRKLNKSNIVETAPFSLNDIK
jgi:hypothetical protein